MPWKWRHKIKGLGEVTPVIVIFVEVCRVISTEYMSLLPTSSFVYLYTHIKINIKC